jgi:hypothetical protein
MMNEFDAYFIEKGDNILRFIREFGRQGIINEKQFIDELKGWHARGWDINQLKDNQGFKFNCTWLNEYIVRFDVQIKQLKLDPNVIRSILGCDIV